MLVFYASKNIGIPVQTISGKDNGTFQLGINIINIQPYPAIIQILDIAYAFFLYFLVLLKSSHFYLLELTECPVFCIPCTKTVKSPGISSIMVFFGPPTGGASTSSKSSQWTRTRAI